MELGQIYKTILPNGRVRLSAEAQYACVVNGRQSETFYFEFPGEVADDLVETGDPWLVLFLPIATKLGEVLRITHPVDPVLLEGCRELMEIWHCWMPSLHIIDIEVDSLQEAITSSVKTASFFSSGVDSLYTLYRHEDEPNSARSEKIDDLITIFGVFGREKELVDKKRGVPMLERMEDIAQRYGKKLIEVHTNARQTMMGITDSLNHSHGCLIAASALALGRYSRVLVPASHVYTNLAPEASHPLTDRLFSTSASRFVTDGCGAMRYEKIAYLASHNHDIASLQVCSRDLDLHNCSDCFKCIRAALILEALGKLQECELFRMPTLDLEKVEAIYCSTSYLLRDLNMVLREVREGNREDIVHAIRTIFRRSAWIDASRRVVSNLRSGKNLVSQEKNTLAELVGVRESDSISDQTIASLCATYQTYPLLKEYLLETLNEVTVGRAFDEHTLDPELRMLEHAILGGSICESNLYMQLLDSSRELDPPKVVYICGKPLVVDKNQFDDSLSLIAMIDGDKAQSSENENTESKGASRIMSNMGVVSDKELVASSPEANQLNQIEKYQSDYFDYLSSPENAPRYRLAIDQVRRHVSGRPIYLVDLGCGNGALAKYIGNDIVYYGIDHNPASIERAREHKWPAVNQPQFEVKNIMEWVSHPTRSGEPKADVLVFSGLLGGVLFSVENQQILAPLDEQQFVVNCMKHRLVDGGLVSVITPFSYDFSKPASLFSFAARRKTSLDQRLPLGNLMPIVESVIPMPQVNHAIARQKHKPQWMQEANREPEGMQRAMGVWCSLFAARV